MCKWGKRGSERGSHFSRTRESHILIPMLSCKPPGLRKGTVPWTQLLWPARIRSASYTSHPPDFLLRALPAEPVLREQCIQVRRWIVKPANKRDTEKRAGDWKFSNTWKSAGKLPENQVASSTILRAYLESPLSELKPVSPHLMPQEWSEARCLIHRKG